MIRKFWLTLAILIICSFFNSEAWSAPCSPEEENIDNLYDVVVYSNGCDVELYWQCVEFAKRFYFQYHHFDVVGNWSGHGNTYHDKPGLIKYENKNDSEFPRLGDTLSFGTINKPHVAIVSNIDKLAKTITFYQQNWSVGEIQNTTDSVKYNIDPVTHYIVSAEFLF